MWQTGGLPVFHRVTVVKLLAQHIVKCDSWVPTSGAPPCCRTGYKSFFSLAKSVQFLRLLVGNKKIPMVVAHEDTHKVLVTSNLHDNFGEDLSYFRQKVNFLFAELSLPYLPWFYF